MLIRSEEPRDLPGIRRVEEEAFGRPLEAEMVDALRANGALTLSLVAEHEGYVLGHVAFSPAEIDRGGSLAQAISLAPVAVLPVWQKRGIGGALVRAGLSQLAQDGHGAVVVLGHPPYYPRFGFRPASAWGLKWEGECPEEAFMALELKPGALAGGPGVVRFRPELSEE